MVARKRRLDRDREDDCPHGRTLSAPESGQRVLQRVWWWTLFCVDFNSFVGLNWNGNPLQPN